MDQGTIIPENIVMYQKCDKIKKGIIVYQFMPYFVGIQGRIYIAGSRFREEPNKKERDCFRKELDEKDRNGFRKELDEKDRNGFWKELDKKDKNDF